MKKLFTVLFAMMITVPLVNATDIEKELMREEINLLKEKLTNLELRMESQDDNSDRSKKSTPIDLSDGSTDRLGANNPVPEEEEQPVVDKTQFPMMDQLVSFPVIRQAYDRLSISGNVDILYYYSDFNTGGGAEDTSDIIADQVRLALDLEIDDYVKGFVALQFEDYQTGSLATFGGGGGDTETDGDLQVDEAYIVLGDWEYGEGLYGIFGKQYFPFGNVNESGNFINDTLVRQLYETRDTGLTAGHKYAGLDVGFFVFNGQLEDSKTSGNFKNKLDTWGASLSYEMDEEDMKVRVGFSYINNLLQAQNTAALAGLDIAAPGTILGFTNTDDNDSQAYNLYAALGIGPFWFSGEYVSALNDLDRDINGDGTNDIGSGVKPEALSLEGAFSCQVRDQEITLAGKYETNNDQDDFGNGIDSIWGIGVASDIFENTRLTLNYEYWDGDNSPTIGGGHANLYLAELSIGF